MKDYNYANLAEYYDMTELGKDNDFYNSVFEKILKNHKVKSVLDITCGTGAQAIYLDKKGYDVTASDYSKEMLNIARKKYPKLKWNQGDMRIIKHGKFDAVISMFNSIGHLSKKDFEKALRNISENLKEEGIYLFDIFNLDFMRKNFRNYEFVDVAREFNDVKIVRFNKNNFNKKENIMHMNQRTYVQKGMNKPKIFRENWDMQIYSSNQLEEILKRNGFKVIKFLSREGKNFDKDKNLFILTIAKKLI